MRTIRIATEAEELLDGRVTLRLLLLDVEGPGVPHVLLILGLSLAVHPEYDAGVPQDRTLQTPGGVVGEQTLVLAQHISTDLGSDANQLRASRCCLSS